MDEVELCERSRFSSTRHGYGVFSAGLSGISIRYRQRFGFASLHLFSTNRLIPMDAEQYEFLPSPCGRHWLPNGKQAGLIFSLPARSTTLMRSGTRAVRGFADLKAVDRPLRSFPASLPPVKPERFHVLQSNVRGVRFVFGSFGFPDVGVRFVSAPL